MFVLHFALLLVGDNNMIACVCFRRADDRHVLIIHYRLHHGQLRQGNRKDRINHYLLGSAQLARSARLKSWSRTWEPVRHYLVNERYSTLKLYTPELKF